MIIAITMTIISIEGYVIDNNYNNNKKTTTTKSTTTKSAI